MKLRVFTGLACALALAGCSTYGYVGEGGGYYTGHDYAGYGVGTGYAGYGYGSGYGYGVPYGYRYYPGGSLGLGYGPVYPYDPYVYARYPRPPYYRPPYQAHPRPEGGDGHHGQPPSQAGTGAPPRLDRAPWRDLERLRREAEGEQAPRHRPGPGTLRAIGPYPAGQPGAASVRPPPAAVPGATAVRPPSVRPPEAQPRISGPSPRNSGNAQRVAPRSVSGPSSSGSSRPQRTATRDTIER